MSLVFDLRDGLHRRTLPYRFVFSVLPLLLLFFFYCSHLRPLIQRILLLKLVVAKTVTDFVGCHGWSCCGERLARSVAERYFTR